MVDRELEHAVEQYGDAFLRHRERDLRIGISPDLRRALLVLERDDKLYDRKNCHIEIDVTDAMIKAAQEFDSQARWIRYEGDSISVYNDLDYVAGIYIAMARVAEAAKRRVEASLAGDALTEPLPPHPR